MMETKQESVAMKMVWMMLWPQDMEKLRPLTSIIDEQHPRG